MLNASRLYAMTPTLQRAIGLLCWAAAIALLEERGKE
jgi:hypothetical protein